jgi:putative transposase
VSAHQATHPITTLCHVLGVSESGYHAWRHRGPSARAQRDLQLLTQIRAFHARSGGTYGAPRLLGDLRDAGERVGKKRIARLLRRDGLAGVSRRRGPARPRRTAPETPPAPDLVRRVFTATAPNQLWVADITYVPTAAGFLYLAVVVDVFSRRVVGWAMRTTLQTTVVLDALEMATAQRRPDAVIHHSDQGSQYAALAFGQRCRMLGVRPSMGSRGDAYDNAMAESFFATLEVELLAKHRFASQVEARLAIFRYIEGWYNPHRRHSALGNRSPLRFEALQQSAPTAA